MAGVLILLVLIYVAVAPSGPKQPSSTGSSGNTSTSTTTRSASSSTFPKRSPLNPDWDGDRTAVTLAFGGDVHFAGVVGERLAQDPSTALGTTFAQLFGSAQVRMVDLQTAITAGSCPQYQAKQFTFYAPPTAFTALKAAGVTVGAQANEHALDCGATGLAQGIAAAQSADFPIVGVGSDATQAYTPYRITVGGQRIAIFDATQIIASNLVSSWTATATQPGVASAIDPTELVRAVQHARRSADTIVVYLDWGTSEVQCPSPPQESLAQQLVEAGADLVVGAGAHVLLGAGYLGSAYVDYGLGNFAFYDDTAPETDSGALLITVEGRHVISSTFAPATDVGGLPQPLSAAAATAAQQAWQGERSCTDLQAAASASVASEQTETVPFTVPTATTTTTTTASGGGTTTTTTAPPPTTTQPTDNAG